ncbi:MAG: OmpA family protein [Chitinophagia bacterium]|jgi:outer membrane protein OmpA-like peptidoglycan-associated protein|nr:OmpA family protein [Chitinophagia bacterium]
MRKSIFVIYWVVASKFGIAQSLVANGNFEDRNICIEFKSGCAPEAWFRFPMQRMNQSYFNRTYSKGYFYETVSMENREIPFSSRSYIYTKLICPLEKGREYRFRVSVFTNGHQFDHIDLAVSNYEPYRNRNLLENNQQNYVLKLTHFSKYVNDWREASVVFTATGEERYLLLGNLSRNQMPYTREYSREDPWIYYDLDSVSLLPVSGKWTPCENAKENLQLLYMNNFRHTEFNFLDDEQPVKDPPSKPTDPVNVLPKKDTIRQPSTDTLLIPDVLFEFDKGVLNPAFYPKLDKIIQVLKQKPFNRLEIIGHTDGKGSAVYNQQLSEQRAKAVSTYLYTHLPLTSNKVTIIGQGATRPVASNQTAAGRTQNRRVEIVIIR